MMPAPWLEHGTGAPDREDVFLAAADVEVSAGTIAVEDQGVVALGPFISVLVDQPTPRVAAFRELFGPDPGLDRELRRVERRRVRQFEMV